LTFALTPGNKTIVKAISWQDFRTQARQHHSQIVLADGEDPRAVEAAVRAQESRIADPLLIGSRSRIQSIWKKCGAASQAPCLDPEELTSSEKDRFVQELLRLSKFKSLSRTEAEARLKDPLILGCLYIRCGLADGFIGGATRTTSETLRAVFSVIGLAPKTSTLFGFFLIQMRAKPGPERLVLLADCAVTPDPSPKQLANIAIGAASAYDYFIGDKAKVAFLSFSTAGSAEHEKVSQIRQALAMAREKEPTIQMEGEWQADAALDLFSAQMKGVGQSPMAGQANVLIAPDLNCGNIAYKLVQRLGGCRAVGPVLWGTALPANDLSRGCSSEDIVDMLALTALQTRRSQEAEKPVHAS
jgi:phosphate acetyltransferase